MNQSPPPVIAGPPVIAAALPSRFKKRYVFALVALLLVVLSVRAVAGYFTMGNEAAALRKSVTAHAGGQCEKKFSLRLGWITTGLVRAGSRLFNLPPEPRTVIDSLHRVEVGVYKFTEDGGISRAGEILAATDVTMTKRGWDRIVGVVHDRQTVAIYAPHKGLSSSNIECAVLVFNGRDLVIAAGSGNPMPLIQLASRKIEKHPVAL
jgi:hypothetical protein